MMYLRYDQCSHLKSNMDRFIALLDDGVVKLANNLKSNMDRFIVLLRPRMLYQKLYLKSNMDRFIDV